MAKNITLRLEEVVLRKCKQLAFEEDKSVSQYVSDMILEAVGRRYNFEVAKKRALKRLEKGLDLGGTALTREEAHAR